MSKEITNQQVVEQVVSQMKVYIDGEVVERIVARVVPDVVGQIKVFVKDHVDERFEELASMFNSYATVVEGRFQEHDKRFSVIDQRFDEVDQKFDKVDQRFDELVSMLDAIMTIANKTHDDHLAAIEWLKRHERHLERHDAEIKKLQLVG